MNELELETLKDRLETLELRKQMVEVRTRIEFREIEKLKAEVQEKISYIENKQNRTGEFEY